MSNRKKDAAAALTAVIGELRDLTSEEQQIIINTASTFYGLHSPAPSTAHAKTAPTTTPVSHPAGGGFSEERDISPKEFIMQKQPRTEVERVACLAYFLTHYRNTPHFKTVDISKLNVEAAQSKMANPAQAADNATKMGYLEAATKGHKQISAAGELFVQALPDREAARAVWHQVENHDLLPRTRLWAGGAARAQPEGRLGQPDRESRNMRADCEGRHPAHTHVCARECAGRMGAAC